jgi:hypothetical protein
MKHLIFLIALVSNLSFAQQWRTQEGNKIPDSDSKKSGKSFGAQLVLTNKDKALYTAWNLPSEGIYIDTSSTVKRHQSISAFIVFDGCKESVKGNCRLVVEFTVIQPDGKLYSQTPPMEVWHEKKKPPQKALELSVDYLKIVFEDGEQVGNYAIIAKVSDLNAHESISLKSKFTAQE